MENCWTIICDDVIHWAKTYTGPKFHALLCDAPYEMNFMGKKWDGSGISFQPETWEVLSNHLFPGAFLMVCAGTLNDDLISVTMREAGLRKFHKIMGWLYGSGFPKATRILGKEFKETDKQNPNHRKAGGTFPDSQPHTGTGKILAPNTPMATIWEEHRYGQQALKPAIESILVFQKPYEGKPVDCIIETGAGALWIDGNRIQTSQSDRLEMEGRSGRSHSSLFGANREEGCFEPAAAGRWPSNFVVSHLPECKRIGTRKVAGTEHRKVGQSAIDDGFTFTETKSKNIRKVIPKHSNKDGMETIDVWECIYGCPVSKLDSSNDNVSRFFCQIEVQLEENDPVYYYAKASKRERDSGLQSRNPHPTVKPISLTYHLASLLLPPPEYAPCRILIPFGGVASEGIGALFAGWDDIVMVEKEESYCEIAELRMQYWNNELNK